MAPIVKENAVINTPTLAGHPSAPGGDAAAKTQAVALELPVSVNGARTLDGSDKREPFSEATKTVLVFGNGAVIRLQSPVAPGQLLFLTNEKTKKEVVCQVVKSKNYRNVSGYVELEFTEQVVGFWGMRFPSDRINSQLPAATAPPQVRAPVSPKSDAAANFNALKALSSSFSTPDSQGVSNPTQPAQSAPAETPRSSEPAKVPNATSPPTAQRESESPSETLKLQTARLQEQLSSMVFAEKPQRSTPVELPVASEIHETAANILEFAKPEPPRATIEPRVPEEIQTQKAATSPTKNVESITSAAPKSLLDAEEVKIPSWLEPLARNVAAASAAEPPAVKDEPHRKEEPILGRNLVAESLTDAAPPAAEPDTAPFGATFMQSEEDVITPPTRGSNKGILIGTVAAGLLLSAAGLTWYLRNQSGTTQANVSSPSNSPAPVVQAAAQPPAEGASIAAVNSPAASTPAAAAPATAHTVATVSTSSGSAGSTNASNAVVKTPQPAAVQPTARVEAPPSPKKPALGEVRLAAPKVKGNNGHSLSADEPGIATNGAASEPTSALGGFGTNSRQPVAPSEPIPVGGDVKTAKLITSVHPVYPQLAKSQHVSGDVKVDALIGANGRVTTMKVVSGPTLLHQAAMDALRQWKYEPATLDGKPVPMHLTVTLQFRLQ